VSTRAAAAAIEVRAKGIRFIGSSEGSPARAVVPADVAGPRSMYSQAPPAGTSLLQWCAGLGLRVWAKGIVARIDTAYSEEGLGIQMMIGQPYPFQCLNVVPLFDYLKADRFSNPLAYCFVETTTDFLLVSFDSVQITAHFVRNWCFHGKGVRSLFHLNHNYYAQQWG